RVPRQAEEEVRATRPEREGLAGLLRHLPEPSLDAERVQRLLHEIELAYRHAAGREHDVGPGSLGEVVADVLEAIAHDRQHGRLAARVRNGGSERIRVAVDHLPAPRRLVHLDQLRARGPDGHVRTAMYRYGP